MKMPALPYREKISHRAWCALYETLRKRKAKNRFPFGWSSSRLELPSDLNFRSGRRAVWRGGGSIQIRRAAACTRQLSAGGARGWSSSGEVEL